MTLFHAGTYLFRPSLMPQLLMKSPLFKRPLSHSLLGSTKPKLYSYSVSPPKVTDYTFEKPSAIALQIEQVTPMVTTFTKPPKDGPIHTIKAPNLGSSIGEHQSTSFFAADLSAPIDNHIDAFQTQFQPKFSPTQRPVSMHALNRLENFFIIGYRAKTNKINLLSRRLTLSRATNYR
jgi:hypothetical protein